jgi:hypothetical protein
VSRIGTLVSETCANSKSLKAVWAKALTSVIHSPLHADRRYLFRDEAVEMLEVFKELEGPLRQKIIITVFRSFINQGRTGDVETGAGEMHWKPPDPLLSQR